MVVLAEMKKGRVCLRDEGRRASKPVVVQELAASQIGVRSEIADFPRSAALDPCWAHNLTRFVPLDVVLDRVLHASHRVRSQHAHDRVRYGLRP